jgi:hypothetical protein
MLIVKFYPYSESGKLFHLILFIVDALVFAKTFILFYSHFAHFVLLYTDILNKY